MVHFLLTFVAQIVIAVEKVSVIFIADNAATQRRTIETSLQIAQGAGGRINYGRVIGIEIILVGLIANITRMQR